MVFKNPENLRICVGMPLAFPGGEVAPGAILRHWPQEHT